MEKFLCDGVVIKTSVTGEADRIIWILTRDKGIIRAFAKGARGTKNKLHCATSLFAYCNFLIYEKNSVYHINEAEIKDIFYDLRKDVETLTIAQYFCEIILKNTPENNDEELYLRLLLNSFYFLCNGKKNSNIIKSVFELKTASIMGYMPSLIACENCGEYLTEYMYFNIDNGILFCCNCGNNLNNLKISSSVVSALRHICYSDFSKIFSFEISEKHIKALNEITEKYFINVTGNTYILLDYLKSLS